jgi:hypothetical protein
MTRNGTFFLSVGYLVGLLLFGLLYFLITPIRSFLPSSFGPVPVGVPWFGALGAVLLSLKGIFEHEHDWSDTYWPWHLSRPLVGASVGIVAVLMLQAGILAVGSDPTPTQPALTGPVASPVATPGPAAGATPVATPLPAGLQAEAPPQRAPAPETPTGPAPLATPVPANLLYYLIAFLVGYREETFRSLLKRLTDLILASSEEGKPAPSIMAIDPAQAAHNVVTPVVIVGSGFTGAESVKFGAAPAKFKLDSDGQISAQAPVVADARQVAVTVTSGGGTATFYPFTYT